MKGFAMLGIGKTGWIEKEIPQVKYYSYDGHYFYTDYAVMLSDYQNNTNGQNAVNAGNAFYNFFQFKNMREATKYSGEELNVMLQSAMSAAGVDTASSKLSGTGLSFVKYQKFIVLMRFSLWE